MKRLHVMVGLPRSGKSTYASAMRYPVVSPDAIRLVLHGTAFRPEAEPMVWGIAKTMVSALFTAGHMNVILDATNVTRARRDEWRNANWRRIFHFMDTPADMCIARALENHQEELIPVIHRMDAEFELITDEERGDWEKY